MADQKDNQDQDRKNTQAPAQTQPAEEWGQREDDARTIASGGKESEKGPRETKP